jgi:hypothetical protein
LPVHPIKVRRQVMYWAAPLPRLNDHSFPLG